MHSHLTLLSLRSLAQQKTKLSLNINESDPEKQCSQLLLAHKRNLFNNSLAHLI